MVWQKGLQQHFTLLQVVAEYRGEQRALRQQQVESREVARCMERLLSQVAAKEHAVDYEVRVVSFTCFVLKSARHAATMSSSMSWCHKHANVSSVSK